MNTTRLTEEDLKSRLEGLMALQATWALWRSKHPKKKVNELYLTTLANRINRLRSSL